MKDAEKFLAELGMDLNSQMGSDSSDSALLDKDVALLLQQIEAKAVALLAMREHGKRELKQKLLTKFPESKELLTEFGEPAGFIENLVEQVLDICQTNNWQSDQRYVEQAVRNYMAKGHGPLKIRQKLQQNCSDSGLISAALDLDDSDWIDLAREALDKKYGDCHKPTVTKEQAKRMRFLQSRGFHQGIIWKAFK